MLKFSHLVPNRNLCRVKSCYFCIFVKRSACGFRSHRNAKELEKKQTISGPIDRYFGNRFSDEGDAITLVDSSTNQFRSMGVDLETIKEGHGKTPKKFDIVEIHYIGWYQGGQIKFASSQEDFGEAFQTEIGTGKVIRGWDEGIMKMSEGGKARMTISPDYAYGAGGYPPVVPMHATLIYEIELLKVIPAEPQVTKKSNGVKKIDKT